MTNNEPVKLLLLEESQNRAEEIIVLLRTAGRATRAHQVESQADLNEKLNEQPWDLLLARTEANGVTAENAINSIRELEKDVPVIIIAEDRSPEAILEGLKLGAKDVALADDDERLVLLAQRELDNLEARRAKRRAEVELRETERRNQLLLKGSTAAIAYVHEGMHINTNSSYSELFGYDDPDDFIGIPIIDLIASDEHEQFKKFLKSYEDNEGDSEEFTCVKNGGDTVKTQMSLSPATYEGEKCMQVVIRTLQEDSGPSEDVLKEMSSQDLLTGLFTREYFTEELDKSVDRATAGEQAYALFFIVIDHFPRIRSEAGISNADLILGEIATLIRGKVPDDHMMARFGDDSFTILYKSGDKEAAAELAEEIRSGVDGHMAEVSGKSYQVTVSIGLSLITENAPSAEEVLSRAHQATTIIEDGNGVNFYQPAQVKVGEDGRALTSEDIKEIARTALENDSLKLLYQPVISLQGEEDEQFEVLLRLPDEEGNELTPGQFMGPVEDAGLLDDMDRWVVQTAIKALAEKRAEGHKTRLFINITHTSIADESFLQWFSGVLKEAKLPSDAIIFQIHENDATGYIKHAAAFAKGAAALHCKVSINHFGCSLNPLNLLKHITPDYAKLDASFAEQLEESQEKQEELMEMVEALQAQGVSTVMAGVESTGALAQLFQAGINYIQGYYVSPPIDNMDYDFAEEL